MASATRRSVWLIIMLFLAFLTLLQIIFNGDIYHIRINRYQLWQYYSNHKAINFTHSPTVESNHFCTPSFDGYFVLDRDTHNWTTMEKEIDCESGGFWTPPCRPLSRVAVIVPFRDRETHLKIFLANSHPYLQRQLLEYRIFVVHQVPNQFFNRAKLMNVGFVEALNLGQFECFIFHDVDLLPANGLVPYNCSNGGPLHMVPAMDKFAWGVPYYSYFGGVCAFLREQFIKINGFSNSYWGWGGEDDDAWDRVRHSSQSVQRLPAEIGRFSMIKHVHDKLNEPNPQRGQLLRKTRHNWPKDGLNSLNYALRQIISHKLYTEILVDLLPGSG